MRILICDSNDSDLRSLVFILRKKYNNIEIDTSHNQEEFLNAMNMADSPYDFIFIDIILGDDSGIPLGLMAQGRFPKAKIVFDSSQSELAELIFVEMHPYAFVNKPFNVEIIYHHIDKVLNAGEESEKTLKFSFNRQDFNISLSKITFIECNRNKITIHTNNGNYAVISTLGNIENQLDENFIKCHQSYLVNLAYISNIEMGDFLLATGERVPISRSKMTDSKFEFMMYKGGIK